MLALPRSTCKTAQRLLTSSEATARGTILLCNPPRSHQVRCASVLGSLANLPTSYSHRIRRGRGPSSGKGKTSGRGHKGQKQHGKVPVGMNGGQTPDEVVAGPRGFRNRFSVNMSALNLDTLQAWVDQGRLPLNRSITVRDLVKSRCLHGIKDGVKLLSRGADQLKSPIKIIVSKASAAAIAAIEAQGGEVITRYYTPWALTRVVQGLMPPHDSEEFAAQKFRFHVPNPVSRKDIEYYRDPAHRGFLSHQVAEGENPSLFFNTPVVGGVSRTRDKKKDDTKATENRLW